MGKESTQHRHEVADEDDTPQSQPDPLVGAESRTDAWLHWLYLHGDRRAVSGLMLVATFVASLALIRSSLITPAAADDVVAISSTLIGGMLPFITVVLAINQLILSEEFGTTGAFFERLEETADFRKSIESHTGVRPSPAEPSALLRTLIEAKRRTTLGLRNVCSDAEAELREDVEEFVSTTVPRDDDSIESLG